MERFDRHVGATNGTFQQRPEVLEAVGVNLPVNVSFGVIDDVVGVWSRRVRRAGRYAA